MRAKPVRRSWTEPPVGLEPLITPGVAALLFLSAVVGAIVLQGDPVLAVGQVRGVTARGVGVHRDLELRFGKSGVEQGQAQQRLRA